MYGYGISDGGIGSEFYGRTGGFAKYFQRKVKFCRSKDVGQQAFAINLGASLSHLYCSSLYKSRMSSKEAVFTCWKSSKFGHLSILSWFLTLIFLTYYVCIKHFLKQDIHYTLELMTA